MGSTFNLTLSSKYLGIAMYVLLTTSFANINIYLNEKWDIEMDRQKYMGFFQMLPKPPPCQLPRAAEEELQPGTS